MKYQAKIPIRLPSLNEYINVCRANWYKANTMKRGYETNIAWFLTHLPKINKPVTVHFHWVEPNRKRDLDNIAFAKKFILDALVKRGVLKDDGMKYVTGLSDSFEIAEKAEIIVTISEVEQ